MTDWLPILGPHPFGALIIGDVRSGKTATAGEIIEQYRMIADPDGVVPTPYMIAPKRVHKQYPEWMKRVEPRGFSEKDVPTDALLYGDDLHIIMHARDWAHGKGRPLEMLMRERWHYNTSVLVTTQDARVVDKNLIPNLSALIIKKPAFFQGRMERSELATYVRKADKLIPDPNPDNPDDIEYKRYAYVVSNHARLEEMVTDCDLAPWWSDEISKAWRARGQIKSERAGAKTFNYGLKGIKMIQSIGRMFG